MAKITFEFRPLYVEEERNHVRSTPYDQNIKELVQRLKIMWSDPPIRRERRNLCTGYTLRSNYKGLSSTVKKNSSATPYSSDEGRYLCTTIRDSVALRNNIFQHSRRNLGRYHPQSSPPR